MDVLKAISRRYSCRDYRDTPVEPEKLTAILDAARLAPSARNTQDWRFVVVTDKEIRKILQAVATHQEFVGQAPVVLVGCSCTNKRMGLCAQPYSSIDVAIALEHIALAATSLGLASCWIGAFYPQQVRQILDIPTHIEVVSLMTLGYPADNGAPDERLRLDENVCREKWGF